MFQHDHKFSFVRILMGDGKAKKPVGAGFLVTPTHVMTCAHVVADALGIERNTVEKPVDIVKLDFPLLERQPDIKTRIIEWFPIKENAVTGDLEDIAVLEMLSDQPLPRNIAPVPVVLLESHILFDRSVRMCGFPYGADEGTYANGTLQGPTGKGWIEIQHELSSGMVQEGFSGTAVWDKKENAVSGMIVSTMSHSGQETAYIIPIESLIRAFPQLDGHSRPPNPYKGLEAFYEKDAPFFFGRETVIEDLSAIVQEQHFVAVIGASGSGKSSVILAGLIPKLKASGKWLVRDFRPKETPFHNLALALIPLLYKDKLQQLEKAKELSEKSSRAKISINDIIRMIAQEHPGQRFLLFADQFEELFTANLDKSVQHRFMDMLLEPQTVSSLPFTFLFTMRADFMSQAVEYSPFAYALDKYKPKILSAMIEKELNAVIKKPAERLGVKLESGLTQRILQDLGNEPGNLPLLEFALTQLWEKQRFKTLTNAAYDTIGGVNQSLTSHADRVLAGFSIEELEQLRQIFIQLVRPGEGTEDTRQVAFRQQFNEKKWDFIKHIADERLVVTGRSEEYEQETVELTHEALIKNWKPLRQWIDEARSFRVWQNNLRQAIADWEQAGKDDGALLRGVRLTDAEEKLEQRKNELCKDEIAFIQTSLSLRKKEIAEKERERFEKEKLRKIIRGIGFAALLVLLVILGLWAMRENEKLIEARHNLGYMFNEKAERALENNNFNAARLYSLYALANFDPNRNGPAKAAGRIISNPDYPILFSSPDGSHHSGIVTSVSFSPDSRTLASGATDKTICLWDVETGKEKSMLIGHTDKVNSVSFSPDGKTLASGSDDNSIRLWDVETGKEKSVLTGHKSAVNSVSFSPDGRALASGSDDNSIRLWDVETGKEKSLLTGHADKVNSVSFSPDGKTLASGSDDNNIFLWDVETRKSKFIMLMNLGIVYGVSFSPDGKTLASSSSDKTIRLWDVETMKEMAELTGHSRSVLSVSFSPDSKTIASGSFDKTIRLWDIETEKTKSVMLMNSGTVYSVSFSPDGKTLASGLSDKTIHMWDVETGKENTEIVGHCNSVRSVCFSPNGKTLASGSDDKTIRLWDVETGEEKFVLTGHKSFVKCLSFSPNGKTLASGSVDNTIRLWDLETKRERAVLTGLWGDVNSVSFSPNDKILASGSDKIIRLWDVETMKEMAELIGHSRSVRSVCFSPNGKTLASGSYDKTIRLWDVETGEEKFVLPEHHYVNSVSFSPNGKTLASSSGAKTIRLWDVETGKLKTELVGNRGAFGVSFLSNGTTLAYRSFDNTISFWDFKTGKKKFVLNIFPSDVKSMSFSPDGKILASGSDDNKIRLWDLETKREKAVLNGHSNAVNSVSFSPDGKTLASSSDDETIRLWDVKTRKLKTKLIGHSGRVQSVSFSPDGKTLVSGGWYGSILFWDVETGKVKASFTSSDFKNIVKFSPDGTMFTSGKYTIHLWDVETGKEKSVLTGHKLSVNSVSFSPDGKTLASGSVDNTIRLWDLETKLETKREKAVLTGHSGDVNSVSFSPDGRTLASGSDDKTIRLWEVETGKEKFVLTGHSGDVNSVSFSPDGSTLASGSDDKTIRLWDLGTRREKAVLTGHWLNVNSVSFSPDSNTLASGASDYTIRLWDISFLYDLRPIQDKIKEAEQAYILKLVNLKLQFIPPKRNLYGVKPKKIKR